MILKNKRDQEAWLRERTLESLKANIYLQENNIVQIAENNNFYKIIKSVTDIPLQNGLYAEVIASQLSGNIESATKLQTPRNISLTGDVTGTVSFDGTKDVSIESTVGDNTHNHDNSTIINLDASKITSGIINIERLPQGALERCVVVADDAARFKLTTTQVQQGDTVKVTSTNKMYFVMDISKLNSEAGYTVYTAGTATEVPWSGVTGKPSTMPNPQALTISLNGASQGTYNGSAAKNINVTASSVGAYAKGETYSNGEIDTRLNGKSDISHTHNYAGSSTVSGDANRAVKLKNYAGETNIFVGYGGTGLTSSTCKFLAGYDAVANGNIHIKDITAVEARKFIDAAPSSHTHSAGQVTQDANNRFVSDTEKTKWNGKADAHSHPYLSTSGGTLSGALTVQGNVTCSDCVTTSDKRLKKDIVKIDNALEKVNQLSGYTFLKEGDEQRTTGLLAQELLNVLPEAVFKREDGYYGVSYGNIVGLLIEATKELQNEIKILRGGN